MLALKQVGERNCRADRICPVTPFVTTDPSLILPLQPWWSTHYVYGSPSMSFEVDRKLLEDLVREKMGEKSVESSF